MPKEMLPEDWFLGLLRSLKIGQEIDLVERATDGPSMRVLVKRTSEHRLIVNFEPLTKVTATKNRAKTPMQIVVRDKKGKVLYASHTSRPQPKAISAGSNKFRRRDPPPLPDLYTETMGFIRGQEKAVYAPERRRAAMTAGRKTKRATKKDKVLVEAGEWFEKLNHPKSGARRLVDAYARNG